MGTLLEERHHVSDAQGLQALLTARADVNSAMLVRTHRLRPHAADVLLKARAETNAACKADGRTALMGAAHDG